MKLVWVCVALAQGCAGDVLRDRLGVIRGEVNDARAKDAYVCAPVELAKAEAHIEFASVELQAGEYLEARREVTAASENSRLALAKSNASCGARDSDKDGLVDAKDKCPKNPEDKDGFEDDDGCPEDDNDEDLVLDSDDKCRDIPEDRDNFEDEDGCPDDDNDQDKVVDKHDRCPNIAGPVELRGCPDTDGDTVADIDDRCPTVPGPPDNQGCEKPKLIVVTAQKIELKQKILFETNKSRIMPPSFAMMNEIVAALKARPSLKVRIEGHTDSRGTAAKNLNLSRERAASVRVFLIERGVEPERLEAVGYGLGQPLADNRTAIGREQNRRVEFIITAQ